MHISKCGGTTIRTYLKGVEVVERLPIPSRTFDHRYHWISNERPQGFVFTLVRHPAHWLRSYWGHRMRMGWRDMYLDRHYASDDMNEFAQRVAKNEPGYIGEIFEAYTDAYQDVRVFRMADGLDMPLRLLGIHAEPMKMNWGEGLPEIHPETLELIEKSEAHVIHRFKL